MAPTNVPGQAVLALLHRWFPGTTVAFEWMQDGSSTPIYRVTHSDRLSYLRMAAHPGEVRDGENRLQHREPLHLSFRA